MPCACARHQTFSITSSTVQWQQQCTASCRAIPSMPKKCSSSYGHEHHPSVCQKTYGSSFASARCIPLTLHVRIEIPSRGPSSPNRYHSQQRKDHRHPDILEPPPSPRQENASRQVRVCHPSNYSLEHQHQQLVPQSTTRGATCRKHPLSNR